MCDPVEYHYGGLVLSISWPRPHFRWNRGRGCGVGRSFFPEYLPTYESVAVVRGVEWKERSGSMIIIVGGQE